MVKTPYVYRSWVDQGSVLLESKPRIFNQLVCSYPPTVQERKDLRK